MKVLKIITTNFASYKDISFDFEKEGLTLIQGATGSGKSTFCDLIPWILFGRTAKGGVVDEIRSWQSLESTVGEAKLETPQGQFNIRRTRGKSNDLSFWYGDSMANATRGKDLQDTQRRINEVLGLDFETYLAAAYYHEFSQTAQFFNTTARNRREICEELVDLSLAMKLVMNAKEEVKVLMTEGRSLETKIAGLSNSISSLQTVENAESQRYTSWETSKRQRLESLGRQYDSYEENRKRIITKKCNACGTVLVEPKEVIDNSPNPYTDRIIEIEKQQNPHTDTVKDFSAEIAKTQQEVKWLQNTIDAKRSSVFDLEQIQEIAEQFRAESILATIGFIENKTNELLSTFFDAEIKIQFEVEVNDKLEVTTFKDGNTASFTQLSKGQRQLLKLCFGLAVMQAIQNHKGISISQLYFDESLDGLDEDKKLKAVKMLETLTLSYDSIFLVEHSEALKTMVDNKYEVKLNNGRSEIAKT